MRADMELTPDRCEVERLALAATLVIRAARTGVGSMLKMMGGGPDAMPEMARD